MTMQHAAAGLKVEGDPADSTGKQPGGAESDHQPAAGKKTGPQPTAANNLNELRSGFFREIQGRTQPGQYLEVRLVEPLSHTRLLTYGTGKSEIGVVGVLVGFLPPSPHHDFLFLIFNGG